MQGTRSNSAIVTLRSATRISAFRRMQTPPTAHRWIGTGTASTAAVDRTRHQLVVKHGERVRVRLMNFSPMQHHPIYFYGHTFWLTGTEGGRIPQEAWLPRNNTLVGVAMVQDFEFIAKSTLDF
jgi:hypothetical protein